MSFRRSMIAACLLLAGVTAHAAPCASVKSKPDAWVAAKVDALVVAARVAYADDDALPAYEKVLDGINASLRQCQLSKDANFIGRYRQFVEYVEAAALDRQPDHELGFVVPDKQYFAETRQFVQIPDFLTEKGFLRAVSRSETLGQAKSYLRRLNSTRDPSAQLIFFSYTSRHLGTPDNDDSYRRLLIVVPGDSARGVPEKWVQFGITDPRARVRIRNLSVVSSLAGADGTSNVYFKDYYRTYKPDGSIHIGGRWELGYGDDNCVQCHKSGVLPIFPEAGSVTKDEQQAVQAVNERFLTYGSPRFGKYLDASVFGPGLGFASLDDRRRRFGARFDETAAGRAMTCNACHRQERLGALGWPMDQVVVSSYIKGGQMPFGNNLKVADRNELYDKLIREYFATDKTNPGILKSWLLGRVQ
jgi:hypothetical protein